jgi:hypothetical protein
MIYKPLGILCVCERCVHSFRLRADDESKEGEQRCTYVRIQSCESGGGYGMQIECPWCNHTHELM